MPSTYEPIATTTVSGTSTSSVTFSSITGSYTDLKLVFDGQANTGTPVIALRLNGSSTANYSRTYLGGNGSAAFSGRDTGESAMRTVRLRQSQINCIWDLMNYSNTTTFKTVLGRGTDASTELIQHAFLFRGSSGSSTAAITSITVLLDSDAFSNGSTLTLYGIKAA